MSTFVLYTYQFAPKIKYLEQYSELFPDKDVSPDRIMSKKQEAFQSLFDNDSAEGKLFDDRFERIAQIMNRFK